MRRCRPEQSARTKNPRDLLQQWPRIDQVFQQFGRRHDVKKLRRKCRSLQFAFVNLKTHITHVLDGAGGDVRSEEHTSELQSQSNLVCRLLLEKKNKHNTNQP